MKIGIIVAGNIGANAAKLFINAGHEIAIANSRGAETLRELVESLGKNARAASIKEAAQFGEIVFVAIPLGKYATLPADSFRGKLSVVVRATSKALTRFISRISPHRATRVCRSKNAAQSSSPEMIRRRRKSCPN